MRILVTIVSAIPYENGQKCLEKRYLLSNYPWSFCIQDPQVLKDLTEKLTENSEYFENRLNI